MDLNENRPISQSVVGELDLPNLSFRYDTTIEVYFFAACDIAEIAMARFHKENVKHVPMRHITFSDGSEGYVWIHYGSENGEHVLIEFFDHWIDPHFLSFWLWLPDSRKRRDYPVDELFDEEIMGEAITQRGDKFGEILVAPVTVRIRTDKTDPNTFLPSPNLLQKLVMSAKENPCIKFWNCFKKREYELAASYIGEVRKLTKDRNQTSFLGAVQGLCYLLAKKNAKAVDQFLRIGADFHVARLERYSDLCFFFAIESAKGMDDLNESSAAMKRITQKIPDLPLDLRKEVSNILISYSASVYIGVVVLCRRILEIMLTQILIKKYETSINDLIEECKKEGVLKGNVRQGLFAILMVAKSKKVLTSEEFKIATDIKDFGNRIHSIGGVNSAIDAKYALQACIHILRRLQHR
jgi:hypothetical protein